MAQATFCAAVLALTTNINGLKNEGYTREEAVSIVNAMEIPEQLKGWGLTSIPVVYSLGKHVSIESYKAHQSLACNRRSHG